MFMRTKTHNAIVEALTFQMDGLEDEIRDLRQTNFALDRTAAKYKQERDALRAELAPLKVAREKALANLEAANRRRRSNATIARLTGGLKQSRKAANAS